MKLIELVEQPTHNTCLSACISMLTGVPVEKVVDVWGADLKSGDVLAQDVLQRYGTIARIPECLNRVYANNVYMLLVPSGNTQELHAIIADTRDGTTKIYDPSKWGKRAVLPVGPDIKLSAFVVALEVKICPHLGIYDEH